MAAPSRVWEDTTPSEALAAGLPVYVFCTACARPPRALDLEALVRRGLGRTPVGELARLKRFRCTHCNKRSVEIQPTLDTLILQRRRLRLSCLNCTKETVLTAREACERFGLATTFHELRIILRCRASCAVRVGAMTETEEADPAARPFIKPEPIRQR